MMNKSTVADDELGFMVVKYGPLLLCPISGIIMDFSLSNGELSGFSNEFIKLSFWGLVLNYF